MPNYPQFLPHYHTQMNLFSPYATTIKINWFFNNEFYNWISNVICIVHVIMHVRGLKIGFSPILNSNIMS